MTKKEYIIQDQGYLYSEEITSNLEVSRRKVNKHPTNSAEYHKWTITQGKGYNHVGKEIMSFAEYAEGCYVVKINGQKLKLDLSDLAHLRDFLVLMDIVESKESKDRGYDIGFFGKCRFVEKPVEPKVIGEIKG